MTALGRYAAEQKHSSSTVTILLSNYYVPLQIVLEAYKLVLILLLNKRHSLHFTSEA